MRLPVIPTRTPLESREPIVAFAVIRALMVGAAGLAFALLGFPYGGSAGAVILFAALPWAFFVLAVTRRSPEAGLNPLIALGDMAVLGLLQAVEPDMYAPAHFMALFLVAAHAHCQGAGWSLVVGALPPLVLIPVTFSTDVPVNEGLREAYEVVFAAACLATALVLGELREAESSARLRARALSRRTIDTESDVRRRLAGAIHDGPLQELTSVDLMLASAEQALAHDDEATARRTLTEARELTRANVNFLRDEVAELGPQGFEELSFQQAVAHCVDLWERRYGLSVKTDVSEKDLPTDVAGPLFRITQEAVANVGKHAGASTVTVHLRRDEQSVVLEIEDDGRGFGHVDPLGAAEPGHIGLASMRERAEMLGGELVIESGDRGTRVCIGVPI